jgi:hypothetical protein
MLVEQGIANPSGVLELLPGVHVARSLIDCVVICRYHCLSFCPFYFCHWSVCLSDFSVSPCNFAIKIVKMITEWINFQEGKNHYDHYLIHDDIWCGPTTLFMMTSGAVPLMITSGAVPLMMTSGAVPLPYSWWHLVRSHSAVAHNLYAHHVPLMIILYCWIGLCISIFSPITIYLHSVNKTLPLSEIQHDVIRICK